MGKFGQYNFKGLNAQTQASILFFLSYIKDPDFDSIALEDYAWEDFTLYFKSGKKVICESKNRTKQLAWGDVKAILSSIEGRKDSLSKADRIQIICNSVLPELQNASDRLKYGFEEMKEVYKVRGYSDNQVELLAKTDFYLIPRNEQGDALMYEQAQLFLSTYLNFWIPDEELERFFDSIMYQKFYLGAEAGRRVSRIEIFDEVEMFRKERIRNGGGGIYDAEARKLESQLQDIIDGLEDPERRHQVRQDNLSVLSAQPKLMFFLMNRLAREKQLVLKDWAFLWEALIMGYYSFQLQRIFDENVSDTLSNAKFVLDFVAKHYKRLSFKGGYDNYAEYYIELAAKALDAYPSLSQESLGLVKAILELRREEYADFELSSVSDREKEALGQLAYRLNRVLIDSSKKDSETSLVQLLAAHFDLISDDDEYPHYTPRVVFQILEEYLSADFDGRFNIVVEILLEQYDKSKWYKDGFKGTEHMGSGASSFSGSYSVHDRHFLEYLLQPALAKKYQADPAIGYQFAKERLLTLQQSDISRDKPDFLNRAAIGLLLEHYARQDSEVEGETYDLIISLLEVRAIPSKYELVFQHVRDMPNLPPAKKWQLIKGSLKSTNGIPANVFVEEITRSLAHDHAEAAIYLAKWSTDPATHKSRFLAHSAPADNIYSLLSSESTFTQGVAALRAYLLSDEFRHETSRFDSTDTSPSLIKVLQKDFKAGLSIFEAIYGHDAFVENDQAIICAALRNLPEDDPKLALKCYKEFVEPSLQQLGSISAIAGKFSNRHAREELVWFTEKLAKHGYFSEALSLVRIFIDDPDPRLVNEPDDPEGTFNYHQKVIQGDKNITINTVRGCLPWVLQKFINVDARSYLSDAIQLLERLVRDNNYYVRVQALIILADFVRVRHSVMDEDSDDFFMELREAMLLKQIAFTALRDTTNQSLSPVMSQLVRVFGNMRSLTQQQALEVLKTLAPMTDEDIDGDTAGLFIFFAEFRKNAFTKLTRENLGAYDDAQFKTLLMNRIESGTEAMKRSLAWHFYKIPKEGGITEVEQKKTFNLSLRYLSRFTSSYSRGAFEYIYMFINDHLESNFDKCFSLWKKAIRCERKYFRAQLKNKPTNETQFNWWANWRNKDILISILEKTDVSTFLDWFEYLIDYPEEVSMRGDFYEVGVRMSTITQDEFAPRIALIYDKLMNMNPSIVEVKEAWKELRNSNPKA